MKIQGFFDFEAEKSRPKNFQKVSEIFGKLIQKYCKAECVQPPVCVSSMYNVQSSLHENFVFSVCARMDNVAYIEFIMWNSISGLDARYHFRLNISCGVAVMVRSH